MSSFSGASGSGGPKSAAASQQAKKNVKGSASVSAMSSGTPGTGGTSMIVDRPVVMAQNDTFKDYQQQYQLKFAQKFGGPVPPGAAGTGQPPQQQPPPPQPQQPQQQQFHVQSRAAAAAEMEFSDYGYEDTDDSTGGGGGGGEGYMTQVHPPLESTDMNNNSSSNNMGPTTPLSSRMVVGATAFEMPPLYEAASEDGDWAADAKLLYGDDYNPMSISDKRDSFAALSHGSSRSNSSYGDRRRAIREGSVTNPTAGATAASTGGAASAGGSEDMSLMRLSRRRINVKRDSHASTQSDASSTSGVEGAAAATAASTTDSSNSAKSFPSRIVSSIAGRRHASQQGTGGGSSGAGASGTTTRTTTGDGGTTATTPQAKLDIQNAVERLNTRDENSDWENVAAAAAVVAASAAAPTTTRVGVQFGVGDFCLVLLTLLNITAAADLAARQQELVQKRLKLKQKLEKQKEKDKGKHHNNHHNPVMPLIPFIQKDMFTIDPVNKYGYPAGEGKSEEERAGPYNYVLCTVTDVHFDEDERYYTVERCDVELEQRADPGWMEPIDDPDALQAALEAAHRSERTKAQLDAMHAKKPPFYKRLYRNVIEGRLMSTIFNWIQTTLIPLYKFLRGMLKETVTHILHGDTGYACKMRLTGINFLVLCSCVYMFVDVFTQAFLPASADHRAAIVGFTVWVILSLELLFEYLIRPPNYDELMQSDKAYAPSTARNLNKFHLVGEALSLVLYIPSFPCVFRNQCGENRACTLVRASLNATTNENAVWSALGRISLGLMFLRVWGLVRHWKQMRLAHKYRGPQKKHADSLFIRRLLLVENEKKSTLRGFVSKRLGKKSDENAEKANEEDAYDAMDQSEDDRRLKQAATIGTGLMIVNSHRSLFMLLIIIVMYPALYSIGVENPVTKKYVDLLQSNNVYSNSTADCDFLENAVTTWLKSGARVHTVSEYVGTAEETVMVLWAQLLPVRCPWQSSDGVITNCVAAAMAPDSPACTVWNEYRPETPEEATSDYFAGLLNVRVGGITSISKSFTGSANFNDVITQEEFSVKALINQTHTIALTNVSLLILLVSMLLQGLIGLAVMQGDAGRLVLHPVQRMLKIVVKYAENPLAQTSEREKGKKGQLGNYETEQLINAVAKIADLLRKCWGVAGAGIISTNLARNKEGKTVVFNPTVPGKQVYALFGFVAILDFGKHLRFLDRDVIFLINDVARVVHDEVYRWALGDSGQCNKNLGSAFLLVFRIGDFEEVHEKLERATDVVFNSSVKNTSSKVRRRKKSSSDKEGSREKSGKTAVQLSGLPGIQAFADRALLGMLKSFAGIHRDRSLQNWKKDFRLGAGVGAFGVSVIYGMDAGWAVEGAVGSEYKIDATYLSPHVNMASRMMSASKQYGVNLLMSQAVEELLSKPCRAKLRHLDTVYVKGSSVAQRIFTYDARYEGVDFFLFERTAEQADGDAGAYNTNIWDTDQDLKAMRQHISDEFMNLFKQGVEQYLEGNWKAAIELFKDADDQMIRTVTEEGYVDDISIDAEVDLFDRSSTNDDVARLRNRFGDGACKSLIVYMEKRNGVAPPDWHGVRKLMSK